MIQRTLSDHLAKLYRYYPVVFLTGPRQSGKTTLSRSLFKELPYVLLETPDIRRQALNDPRHFLESFSHGAILDEIQNTPEIFSYLQGIVDEHKDLRFVLTGSQNFLLNEKITQSLAGRTGLAELLPLSIEELKLSGESVKSYEKLLVQGFYPRLYDQKMEHEIFYPSYVQTYLERDVRQLKNIGDLSQFDTFIRLCAGRTGQIINLSSLALDAGISVNTAKAWLSILEASYIVFLINPYFKNYNKRLIKSPKLYFTDTGLACYLLGIKNVEQAKTHFAVGALYENFIISEIQKFRVNRGEKSPLYYWRDNKGLEIDLIIENGTSIQAVEIKAGKTFNHEFVKNIAQWSKITGTTPEQCFIVYNGVSVQKLKEATLLNWQSLEMIPMV